MTLSLPELAVAREAAQDSFDQGAFRDAAARWRAIAAASDGYTAQRALYDAATAHARDGDLDGAFARLDEALTAQALSLDQLEADAALAPVRADPRWPAWRARAAAAFAAWEATLGDAALRRELLQLREEDQAVRIQAETDPTALQRFLDVDAKTSARLREMIAAHGWPGRTLVGDDGADAAWLIAQHATLDRAFQQRCLELVREAVARGDAEPRHVAYLEDRLAVWLERPQRYGTQYDGETLEPSPIEDEAYVDERRRSVGLCSLAANTRQIRARWRR
jgi:hypothetical protein